MQRRKLQPNTGGVGGVFNQQRPEMTQMTEWSLKSI